jgi:type III pantothenate kinase
VLRIAADLGNSRLKWGRVGDSGRVEAVAALPTDDPAAWEELWREWSTSEACASAWAVSSVNPPAAERLRAFVEARRPRPVRVAWYRSAVDVGLRHALVNPETAGADRALAVAAAVAGQPAGRPGLVVLCGTALTVERVTADGVWQGGAIASGLGLTARALHALTAQLPLIDPTADPPPQPWGNATRPALEAGVFWGVVGAVRELLTRQSAGLTPTPWVVWSGGDAEVLARAVAWGGARVVPDLVLKGLADVAFRVSGKAKDLSR